MRKILTIVLLAIALVAPVAGQTFHKSVTYNTDTYEITDFWILAASNNIAITTNLWAGVVSYTNEPGYTNVSDALDALFAGGTGAVSSVSGDGTYTTNSGTASDPVISLLATNLSDYNNDAGFVTATITNGLASTNWVSSNFYLASNPSNFLVLGDPGASTNLSDYNNDAGFVTGVAWGDVTGTLSNQADLWTELTNRYTKAEIAALGYLSTNDSPTMAAGTDWTFALASVTNNASSGTDIVNYQTMTGMGYHSWGSAPATTNSAGTPGQMAYSSNYLYICVTNNTWRRTILATW